MEKGNNKKDEKISKLYERSKDLESKNKGVLESLNESEQYSRRNCLLFHRIKEELKEDKDDVITKSFSEDLDIELD